MPDAKPNVSHIASSEAPAAAAQAPTPSERIIRDSERPLHCTDVKGRKFVLRRMKPSDRLRVADALGSERSKNELIFGNAMVAASIASIDGQMEGIPVSYNQVLALVDRVGDEGLAAVAECIGAEMGIEQVGDPAAIKN
jgi:hypothetical protein